MANGYLWRANAGCRAGAAGKGAIARVPAAIPAPGSARSRRRGDERWADLCDARAPGEAGPSEARGWPEGTVVNESGNAALLSARELSKEFGRGEALVRAVDGIDLDVPFRGNRRGDGAQRLREIHAAAPFRRPGTPLGRPGGSR